MSFTFKHVDDFCIATRESSVMPKPGQIFKIDGKYVAVAGHKSGKVSFLVKKGSWLDGFDKEFYECQGPMGDGFKNPDCQKAIVVVGGTGIGAVTRFLDNRPVGSETHLVFYQKGPSSYSKLVDELEIFPYINTWTLWNTTKQGRPTKPLDVLLVRSDWRYDFKGSHVFVAGPKSLEVAVREQCKELGVPDENFHLNY